MMIINSRLIWFISDHLKQELKMQSWESSVWVRKEWKVSNWKAVAWRTVASSQGVEGSTELAGIVDPGQVNMMKKHDHPRANGGTMMMVWVADQENNWSILSLISMISRQHIFCTYVTEYGPGLHLRHGRRLQCWQKRIERLSSDSHQVRVHSLPPMISKKQDPFHVVDGLPVLMKETDGERGDGIISFCEGPISASEVADSRS